ncbi:MAG: indolepyruvate ferredoxin oxidoreductase subunit alpha [Anaeroplasma sp.]|uniref:indolepyruvate ferredoxin oxidoreductase subunit alpha n=1 Tax=Anaeroplasma sp. TaxID=1872523 RepID=UPI002A91B865|nr:indolepyruvate ferredoxin oxidoreductase subunit alpha [Anaeroplasma sp.]MDY5982545.1 indolepyruvate ferredoxin oxidoreductase subunit alpha [Anaeroplasma sp.]
MKKLLIGNAAVARGAYEAGVSVVSSYPGTPSTEITESMVQYSEVQVEWAPNEKVAAEVSIGASMAGARAMSCMKHVGMNVMADPLFTVSYIGVNGGLVYCVADDPGMHSSQNEQDSRHYAKASKVLMVEPSDSKECKEYTKLAFELSEEYDVPVLVRLSTRVSHSQGLVELEDRVDYKLKDYEKSVAKNVMMPAMAIKRHVVVEERQAKLVEFANKTTLNTIENNGKKIGVITAGISYMYSKEALGNDVDYLKLGMVYPLPTDLITDFAKKHDVVYIIEELDPFIEEHVRALGVCNVKGKNEFTLLGEYTPAMIKKVVLGIDPVPYHKLEEAIPNRPPVMCAGCPHRGTFYTLKKLGLTVSGDIGCYTLGATKPLDSVDSTICMGASVSAAFGMAKARGKEFAKKLVSVIGDSTFIHSGITGLIDIVYNKGINTVIILDNSITGMTGHQQNPTTGKTIYLEETVPVNLITLSEAVGVKSIRVCDPFDVKAFEAVVKEEIAKDEPSVIIAQRPCALLKGVKYTGYCKITDQCKKCKQCLKLGCPAISMADGVVKIDETQCNGCGLCINVCPFHAIVKEEA